MLSRFPNPKLHTVLITLPLTLFALGDTYEKSMKQTDATATTKERYERARGRPVGSPDRVCGTGAANVDRREMLKLVLLKRLVGVGSAARFVTLLEKVALL